MNPLPRDTIAQDFHRAVAHSLGRRAKALSVCGVACSLASAITKIPDFIWAGVALEVAAIFYGLSARTSVKALERSKERERIAYLRSLRP